MQFIHRKFLLFITAFLFGCTTTQPVDTFTIKNKLTLTNNSSPNYEAEQTSFVSRCQNYLVGSGIDDAVLKISANGQVIKKLGSNEYSSFYRGGTLADCDWNKDSDGTYRMRDINNSLTDETIMRKKWETSEVTYTPQRCHYGFSGVSCNGGRKIHGRSKFVIKYNNQLINLYFEEEEKSDSTEEISVYRNLLGEGTQFILVSTGRINIIVRPIFK